MLADDKFLQSEVLAYLFGLSVSKEEGDKSTRGDMLFLLGDPLKTTQAGL